MSSTKVFRLFSDTSGQFQQIFFDGDFDAFRAWADSAGDERASPSWSVPPSYIQNPLLKRPDAWWTTWGASFAVVPDVASTFDRYFLSAGTLVDLVPDGGPELSYVRVTAVVNCLDQDRSKLIGIPSLCFREARLPAHSLFCIPESGSVFCVEDDSGHPGRQFRSMWNRDDLDGLLFWLVWDSDGGSRESQPPLTGPLA